MEKIQNISFYRVMFNLAVVNWNCSAISGTEIDNYAPSPIGLKIEIAALVKVYIPLLRP